MSPSEYYIRAITIRILQQLADRFSELIRKPAMGLGLIQPVDTSLQTHWLWIFCWWFIFTKYGRITCFLKGKIVWPKIFLLLFMKHGNVVLQKCISTYTPSWEYAAPSLIYHANVNDQPALLDYWNLAWGHLRHRAGCLLSLGMHRVIVWNTRNVVERFDRKKPEENGINKCLWWFQFMLCDLTLTFNEQSIMCIPAVTIRWMVFSCYVYYSYWETWVL